MKGLMYYDATLESRPWHCNICGREHDDFEAWVYKEGDTILLFCGDTVDCRDEFLELNELQDAGEEEE